MIILGLDLSTSTGYALMQDGVILSYDTIIVSDANQYSLVPDYAQIDRAINMAAQIKDIILKLGQLPDWIYIEQTNKGKNRVSQKQLEFVHFAMLTMLRELGLSTRVKYVDTSAWRKKLGIGLSKEQRAHNKLVKQKKARGKITWKHLSVAWVKLKFGVDLQLQQNDVADALALCTYGFSHSQTSQPKMKDLSTIF
jgi:hypothetical protein